MSSSKQDNHLDNESISTKGLPYFRIRLGLIFTILGFIIFLLGARPSIFGLDRSPVIGFVQIGMFLVGLAIMCLGGYISMMALWNREAPSILADIGLRLVATGFVIAVFAGMADVFGFGSHPLPDVPYFGGWQTRGVEIGEAIIAIGFLFMVPFKKNRTSKTIKN
ncbi:MAG: hypothetical protein CVU41_14775 [Chloroflexi bacterium HGW-Chloroflexi-3]|nr:MAG: hypothetical protein CVU41_14775 [Chloroflexi bacterium HGW-Chloroflexi-3]